MFADDEKPLAEDEPTKGGSALNGLAMTLGFAVVGKSGRPGDGIGEDENETSHSPLAMDDAGLLNPPTPLYDDDSFFSFCL